MARSGHYDEPSEAFLLTFQSLLLSLRTCWRTLNCHQRPQRHRPRHPGKAASAGLSGRQLHAEAHTLCGVQGRTGLRLRQLRRPDRPIVQLHKQLTLRQRSRATWPQLNCSSLQMAASKPWQMASCVDPLLGNCFMNATTPSQQKQFLEGPLRLTAAQQQRCCSQSQQEERLSQRRSWGIDPPMVPRRYSRPLTGLFENPCGV